MAYCVGFVLQLQQKQVALGKAGVVKPGEGHIVYCIL